MHGEIHWGQVAKTKREKRGKGNVMAGKSVQEDGQGAEERHEKNNKQISMDGSGAQER